MFKIFVENKQLEIPDKNFSVTLELADTLNLEGGKSSKSTSIDIPLNVNNENILDLTKKFVDAELISGWFSIRGILYFLEIKKEINRKTLKAQFVWQTGTFVENNKNKLLSDLDIPVNFTYNYTTLTNSWNNTEKYVFDFCSRGKRIEEFNTAYTSTDLKPFHLVEFFPAIRLTEIIKSIFKGYTFDSDFVTNNPDYFLLFTQDNNLFNNKDDVKKLNCECSIKTADYGMNYVSQSLASGASYSFSLKDTIVYDTDTGTNNIGYIGAGLYYTQNEACIRIMFSGWADVQSFTSPNGRILNTVLSFYVYKRTNGVTTLMRTISHNIGTVNGTSSSYAFAYDSGYMTMTANTYIYVDVRLSGYLYNAGTLTETVSGICRIKKDITTFKIESSGYMARNKIVDNLSYFLPNVEQLKFLKGLIQMFNLYILIDENQRKVFIDKKSDFYSKSAIDYTDFIDISKEIVNEIQQEKIVKLGLKPDNSDDNQKEENSFNTYFYNDNGETQENINEVFSSTTIGKNETDKILCPILHSKEIGFGSYYKCDEYKTKFELRILKYEGIKNSVDYKVRIGTNIGSLIDDVENTENTYPLFTSYGDSENLVFNTQNGLSGLESNFTESLQQIVNGEKITFEAILPIDILTNLMLGGVTGDLRYPIYIGLSPFEGYYEIQKVENITGYSNRVKIEALKKFENTYITK